MSIGSNIKKFRLKQKLKQSELAEKAGISRVAIGNYERDERTPNAEILLKIAKALDVTLSELMDLTPNINDALLQELKEIKKELQDIRSILEQGNKVVQNDNFTDYLLQCVIHYQAEMTKTNIPNLRGNQCDEV